MSTLKRKGARSNKDIPSDILDQLNAGEIPTANLVEWLAVDQQLLLTNLLAAHSRTAYLAPILAAIAQLKKPTVNNLNEAIGLGLLEHCLLNEDCSFLQIMKVHPADIVRCWACYMIAGNPEHSIAESLDAMQAMAADEHFGVREISWLAIRNKLIAQLEESIVLLQQWTNHADENIRRFASESIRPRAVWGTHSSVLKEFPEKALPILEALKADPARYVQDSVGNWLNDASKTRPDFVIKLTDKWAINPSKETAYILKKALRTLNK